MFPADSNSAPENKANLCLVIAPDRWRREKLTVIPAPSATPDRKLTRQEFIDAIFSRPCTLTRFDATVLTVEPRGNDWAALVLEKLEGEIKDNSGKTSKIYVMGVVRDGWGKLNDNQWTLLWSEQLGQQLWEEQIPPIANW